MEPDQILRGILFVEALFAVLLYGGFLGHHWIRATWATRITLIGGGGVLVYVLLGQVKAFLLDVPFDAYSTVGFLALPVFIGGLLAVRHKERNRHEVA